MRKTVLLIIFISFLLTGCSMAAADSMYTPPRRSEIHRELQTAIDMAMTGMEYSAPRSGENRQPVQKADLDGDGESEFLLFARGSSGKALQILIFRKSDSGFALQERIDCNGVSFDQVEYVDVDDRPGLELVAGSQLSDQVLRSVSIYTFSEGHAKQLMTGNYNKYLTCDLDRNELRELVILRSGDSGEGNGVAECFSFRDGIMERSAEVPMSQPAENMKRIMVSKLSDQRPAVFAASAVDESSIITDVFAVVDGKFTNVSLSGDSGTSVQTLRNYFVYADDIDMDGVMELPELITMRSMEQASENPQVQHLIQWYALRTDGSKVYKMCTYHNFGDGWYITLNGRIAQRVCVRQTEGTYSFYLWDKDYTQYRKFLTVYAFTAQDRETQATTGDRFILHREDAVIYAAELGPDAESAGATTDTVKAGFHLIRQAWKTGET